VFDTIDKEDMILAFFPCIRFENQVLLWFRGENYGQRTWGMEEKLEYDLKLHNELNLFYSMITKLVIVCLKRNIKLIIENPNSSQHYLTNYWALKSSLVDNDRTIRGDYYKKPTQYWFVNCEPHHNVVFKEQVVQKEQKAITKITDKVERSMISKEYARNFIEEFILDGEEQEENELSLFDLMEN